MTKNIKELRTIIFKFYTPFMHVNLSNIVLQYCQPMVKIKGGMGSWHDLLEKNGTYVHNITFVVDDLDDVVEKFKKEGIDPLFTFNVAWDKLDDRMKSKTKPVYMMNTMEKLGFHMEFGEIPTEEEREVFSDLLYTDLNQK